jgi:hypothetical protein
MHLVHLPHCAGTIALNMKRLNVLVGSFLRMLGRVICHRFAYYK